MVEPALKLDRVRSGYADRMVLQSVDLSIGKGELTAIIGPNGHGKSTLLKTISGILRVREGEISLGGSRIDNLRPDEIVERGVIHVPQGDLLFPGMSIHENLMMGAYRTRETGAIAERLERVFALLPKLRDRRNQLAGTLSGGERRMCGIGRGLMAGGDLLMLDEPSLGLAPAMINELFDILAELRDEGVTILLVDQMAALALTVADRGYVLEQGRFVREGEAAELAADPALEAAYLGAKEKSVA
jgi:branched-chain amino acid transport system ATP-binding protein